MDTTQAGEPKKNNLSIDCTELRTSEGFSPGAEITRKTISIHERRAYDLWQFYDGHELCYKITEVNAIEFGFSI